MGSAPMELKAATHNAPSLDGAPNHKSPLRRHLPKESRATTHGMASPRALKQHRDGRINPQVLIQQVHRCPRCASTRARPVCGARGPQRRQTRVPRRRPEILVHAASLPVKSKAPRWPTPKPMTHPARTRKHQVAKSRAGTLHECSAMQRLSRRSQSIGASAKPHTPFNQRAMLFSGTATFGPVAALVGKMPSSLITHASPQKRCTRVPRCQRLQGVGANVEKQHMLHVPGAGRASRQSA